MGNMLSSTKVKDIRGLQDNEVGAGRVLIWVLFGYYLVPDTKNGLLPREDPKKTQTKGLFLDQFASESKHCFFLTFLNSLLREAANDNQHRISTAASTLLP